MKIFIYKTNTGNYYIESDETFKKTKVKTVLFEVSSEDCPVRLKKTKLTHPVDDMNSAQNLLAEIFGNEK